jgi:hypothetical protein
MSDLRPVNAGNDIQGRVPGQLLLRIEDWRRCQPKIPSRSEAIRQLIERALAMPIEQDEATAQ